MTRMQGDDSIGLTNEHAHKTYTQVIAIGAVGIIRQLMQPYYTVFHQVHPWGAP